MDPKTIDLLWEMHTELGSKEPIHIICGYRSEQTNNMLRRTVGGQAKKSKHMTGQAIDATFPDIPLKQMRWSAAIREVGGIGYYPTSGVPFVHVDTGPVRAWPRLPRSELALLFPNGKTKHQPADGGSISKDDVRKRARQHGGGHAGGRLLRDPQSSEVGDRDRRGRGRGRAARAGAQGSADAGCVAGARDTRRLSRARSL